MGKASAAHFQLQERKAARLADASHTKELARFVRVLATGRIRVSVKTVKSVTTFDAFDAFDTLLPNGSLVSDDALIGNAKADKDSAALPYRRDL